LVHLVRPVDADRKEKRGLQTLACPNELYLDPPYATRRSAVPCRLGYVANPVGDATPREASPRYACGLRIDGGVDQARRLQFRLAEDLAQSRAKRLNIVAS
jgi:hypothetical protein